MEGNAIEARCIEGNQYMEGNAIEGSALNAINKRTAMQQKAVHRRKFIEGSAWGNA